MGTVHRKLSGILRFYRQYAFASVLLNCIFLYFFVINGKDWNTLVSDLLLKMALAAGTYLFYNQYISSRYYFFFNRGLDKKTLWLGSLATDLLITSGMLLPVLLW
ncbi:hypothetical protein GCM10023092_20190 [Rurimicrobium arvi]|uniref:GtrA family protein n=1 Tax=Rurimicrobium arvi TaxID=2049916 RepID=A0ABP8MTI1_9BACT